MLPLVLLPAGLFVKHTQNSLTQYLVNKHLPAAGISQENARGSEVVQNINICPRSEASRATVKV